MNTITTTWTDELNAALSFVNYQLEGLAESSSDVGGKIHISDLANQAADLAPSFEPTLLKNLLSHYINSCEGYKVVRGQFGGAMRDNDSNRSKKEKNAEEVAARKAERVAERAHKEAEAEAKRQERARVKAAKAAEKATAAEQARLAAEAAAAKLQADSEVEAAEVVETEEVAV